MPFFVYAFLRRSSSPSPAAAQRLARRRGKAAPGRGGLRAAHLPQAQGEKQRQGVAARGEQCGKAVAAGGQQGEHAPRRHQPRQGQSVINRKDPQAVPPFAGEVENGAVHAGKPCLHHRQQDALGEEIPEGIRLPEHQL